MSEFKKEVKIPTIHLNGTSAESLQKALQTAFSAIGTAEIELRETSPNARDYYVQGDYPDTFHAARARHWERLAMLGTIRQELLEIHEGIDKQIADRRKS